MSDSDEGVLLRVLDGHVLTLTLNRPEVLNAINHSLDRALANAWHEFAEDDEAWVAVVTGSGDRAFSAGADLKEMATGTPAAAEYWSENPPVSGIRGPTKLWKPVIAAIDGYCIAGGLELALACDLRVATTRSTFGLAETRRGIIPGAGGTQRLMRAIPSAIALELLLTGRMFSAQEAERWGMINRLVPQGDHLAAAMELAEAITSAGPLAVRAAKEAALRGSELPLEDALRLELLLYGVIAQSDDAQEGPTAFAEKRPPSFTGQ